MTSAEPVAHVIDPLPPDERVVTERFCVNFGAGPTQTVVHVCAAAKTTVGGWSPNGARLSPSVATAGTVSALHAVTDQATP